MTKHGLDLAGLSGLGFSILATLSLRASFLWLAVPGWYCVYPGIRIAEFLAWPDSVLLILMGNAALYSALAFLILLGFKRIFTTRAMRLASVWLAFPVAVLVFLALYPSLNPMLPGGTLKLERQATKLSNEFPDATNLEQAHGLLRSKNIYFSESEATAGWVLLGDGKSTFVAASGDRLIKGGVETNSGAFPCGYDVSLDLLFDTSGKLKQRKIRPTEGACL
jgi:hypothetical protein